MKKHFGVLAAAILCCIAVQPTSAAVLVAIDFSGTGAATGAITSTDSQLSFDSGITFVDDSQAATVVGAFNYDGTGTAAVNSDLFGPAAANFGSPTRIDVWLDVAAPGFTYSITSLELDVRANNEAGSRFAAGYRDAANLSQVVGDSIVSIQSGADPISTYSIDVTSENLTATEFSTSFGTAGNGKIRFLFREAVDNASPDNFQVAGVRVIGDVVAIPEPSSIAILGLGGLTMLRRRRS